ncbi:hypothetical protein CDL60_06115 [Roseateles noduli]|nr:hypothetical protein CDL60_06115 [Roseateles noduli]
MADSDAAMAAITRTPPLTVGAPHEPALNTPGNVGLCLSGGGTRACCAGMGQLRALAYLQANGASLLSQIKALSTVSGGSWLGVPYMFLPTDGPSDDDYLGVYDADQGALKPVDLHELPPGNAGVPMASETFSIEGIAATALIIHALARLNSPDDPLPANMLWQTVIALHILAPCGLFLHGDKDHPPDNYLPRDMFTANSASLHRIESSNAHLPTGTAHLFATGSARAQRPFLLCNMGMFQEADTSTDPTPYLPLVPVQATGFFGGVVGEPSEKIDGQRVRVEDANGRDVGGGGVDAFAVSSTFVDIAGEQAAVQQTRPWALADIMGTSSAAFAFNLQQVIDGWQRDRLRFRAWLAIESAALHDWIERHLPPEHHDDAKGLVDGDPLLDATLDLLGLGALIPEYQSWPVADPGPNPKPNRYADGGSLDNTGLASMLAYGDVDRVIVWRIGRDS